MNNEQIVKALKEAGELQVELVMLSASLAQFSKCSKCGNKWADVYDPILGECDSTYHESGEQAQKLLEKVRAYAWAP